MSTKLEIKEKPAMGNKGGKVVKSDSQTGKKKSYNNTSKKVPFPYLGTPDFRGYWI